MLALMGFHKYWPSLGNSVYAYIHTSYRQSSLLMMILGELTLLRGQKEVCGTVSYVPQESWLLPDTVRKNIIFDKEYDEDRYLQVLQTCSLDEVIQTFNFIMLFVSTITLGLHISNDF